MAKRVSLRELAQRATNGGEKVTIAGKPANVCPHCGAGMLVDGVNRTDREIVRYVVCRNEKCQRRFMTTQPPAKLVREIEQDSADGNASLTIFRDSA